MSGQPESQNGWNLILAGDLLRSGAGMKINLQTKIRFNGQEYSSLEDLPPAVRAAYEKMVGNNPGTLPTSDGLVSTRIVFNGQKFDSPNEMPEAERAIYNDLMRLVRADSAVKLPEAPAAAEIGWLTANQKKFIAVVAGFVLAAALVIAVRFLGQG